MTEPLERAGTEVPPQVRMEGVSRVLPGVQALSEARFELRTGERDALAGADGAGKSTLLKLLPRAGFVHAGHTGTEKAARLP